MSEGNGDQGKAAADAILRGRGLTSYEILDRAPLIDHPAGNEAFLVRHAGAPPEILIVRVDRPGVRASAPPEAVLREALDLYGQATRATSDLLRRYENERDRTAIERTLRAHAAGEITREQAVEALGLPNGVQLASLQREFGIPGPPRMVEMPVDAMQGILRAQAEDWQARSHGIVPTGDYARISDMRQAGSDDAAIRESLGLRAGVALPPQVEIERYLDSLVYGIEPGVPRAGVTVTVTVGTKHAKVRLEGTDGTEAVKVASPRYVGRTLSVDVDAALDRMRRDGALPNVSEW